MCNENKANFNENLLSGTHSLPVQAVDKNWPVGVELFQFQS